MYIKFLVVLPREPRINDFEMKDPEKKKKQRLFYSYKCDRFLNIR